MSDENPKPKIIVDADWKEQVQAEKEAAQAARDAPPEAPAPEGAQGDPAQDLPPPSFPLLVSTIATQALAAMGQLRDPNSTEEPPVDFRFAQHQIDMLAVIEEKTKGNLSAEESTMLENVLHELRMLFVNLHG